MAGYKAALKNIVERMLHACEALGGVVVFVVYVQVVVAYGLARLGCEEVVVDKRFRSLAGKFHHHACRRVCVHVGVLSRDVVALGLDYFMEHIACLSLACDAALVAVGDISFCHFLTRAVHQLKLDHVLYFLDGHALGAVGTDAVGYFLYQGLVFAKLGREHGFADGRLDFFFVITDDSAVAFYNCLYHCCLSVCEFF